MDVGQVTFGQRSIPACAGEPALDNASGYQERVYPRVCGGTIPKADAQVVVEGLSPRVRGNRGLDDNVLHQRGSIPACAGEPSIAR